jgi:hypothetical protein
MKTYQALKSVARCIVSMLEAGYHAQPTACQIGGGL